MSRRSRLLLLAAVAVVWFLSPLVGRMQSGRPDREVYEGREVVANEVLVRFAPAAAARMAEVYTQTDARQDQPVGRVWRRIRSNSQGVDNLIRSLARRGDVLSVEPNYIYRTTRVPNDPQFPSLWGLKNTTTAGADIHATSAWDIAVGSTSTVVGVVDTGVDYAHPDLAANIWSAPSAFSVTVGGRVLNCPAGSHGFNALAFSCDPQDDNGHGTHVSGTIGAAGNNSVGVAGVNWNTRIMGLKFLDASGSGSTSDIINVIDFVSQVKTIFGAAANVRVLSNSYGGGGFSPSLQDAITRMATADVLFVAAAGNSGVNIDTTPFYPASYDNANVVAVAATDSGDGRAGFSNYGATAVDLGAPGVSILSTWPGNNYAYLSGTSMATPHVSGAAALVLSACGLNTTQLKSALLSNVDAVASMAGITVTGGRLNVDRAIRSCATVPAVTMVTPTEGSAYTAPATISLSATASDPDGIARVEFYADTTLIGTATTAPFGGSWSGVPAGSYTLTAKAYDTFGLSTVSAPVHVTVNPAGGGGIAPWVSQDIGAVGAAGSASLTSGVFTVRGAGADIWNAADGFQFVYQPLVGDGQIVARVTSLVNTDPWAKAGVMLREDLSAGARHVSMLVTASNGIAYERRQAVSGASAYTPGPSGPKWLKLVRSGTSIIASYSSDGSAWTVIGTEIVGWGANIYVGLAVTSHVVGTLTTATLDNVAMTVAAPPPPPPPPGSLPSPWLNQDVGSVGAAGGASVASGVFTVQGAGADIWNTADGFQFVFQPLSGDGQIVARVASLGNTDPWAKAGVMLREDLSAGARHVSMLVTSGNGLAYERRLAANGASSHTPGPSGPLWVKLVRSGTSVIASYSSDGSAWTAIGSDTVGWGTNIYVGLAVTSHVLGTLTTAKFDNVTVGVAAPPPPPPPPGSLPSPWLNQDVGTVGAAGSATVAGGLFTVQGAGADIWNTADGFQFVYQPLSGDGQIVARVQSLGNTDPWAKAGVMFREDLTAGARHISMLLTPANGVAFERRLTTNGSSLHTNGPSGPTWMKLVRSGTSITASYSSDGVTWTVAGSETIAWGTSVYAGLAVTSHSLGVLTTATFDNVAVTSASPPPPPPPPGTLPSPWVGQDVGVVGSAGSAGYASGLFTVQGAGADIWNTADGFQYVYQPLSGDGQIVARVTGLTNTDPWAKAGVMLREDLSAGSRHVSMLVTASNGIAYERRLTANSDSLYVAGPAGPRWVRLVRTGTTVTASYSSDGLSWSVLGTQSVSWGANVYVGLAITSHVLGTLTTATIDNVTAP